MTGKADEPRWFESEFGKVLAVRCAGCVEHLGHRHPTSYSNRRDACPGCGGSAWIVLVTLERR